MFFSKYKNELSFIFLFFWVHNNLRYDDRWIDNNSFYHCKQYNNTCFLSQKEFLLQIFFHLLKFPIFHSLYKVRKLYIDFYSHFKVKFVLKNLLHDFGFLVSFLYIALSWCQDLCLWVRFFLFLRVGSHQLFSVFWELYLNLHLIPSYRSSFYQIKDNANVVLSYSRKRNFLSLNYSLWNLIYQ